MATLYEGAGIPWVFLFFIFRAFESIRVLPLDIVPFMTRLEWRAAKTHSQQRLPIR